MEDTPGAIDDIIYKYSGLEYLNKKKDDIYDASMNIFIIVASLIGVYALYKIQE